MNGKNKIFIIEGCDCSGKSTLINLFKQHNPKAIEIKFDAKKFLDEFKGNDLSKYVYCQYRTLYETLKCFKNQTILLNRSYHTDYVYSLALKRNINDKYFNELELLFKTS